MHRRRQHLLRVSLNGLQLDELQCVGHHEVECEQHHKACKSAEGEHEA